MPDISVSRAKNDFGEVKNEWSDRCANVGPHYQLQGDCTRQGKLEFDSHEAYTGEPEGGYK